MPRSSDSMEKKPKFDYSLCMACGLCFQSCPSSNIRMNKTDVDVYKKAYPQLDPDGCSGCGICKTVCPTEAVTMTGD